VTPAASAARQAKNGRVRVLAVTAPVRLGGLLAQVPTWREFGVDAVFASPRGVIGPKGMTPAQIAFWDDALEKVVQTGDWKEQAAKYYWSPQFLKSAASAKFLKTEYVRYREVLVELGLARPGSKH
jgi:putative tricarboxylic transport membrane protein